MKQNVVLKPDAKGRVTLGKMANGISSFRATQNILDGKIVLEPYTEIPLRENWLYTNTEVYSQLKQGIKESKKNQTKYIGDFSQYLDLEDK